MHTRALRFHFTRFTFLSNKKFHLWVPIFHGSKSYRLRFPICWHRVHRITRWFFEAIGQTHLYSYICNYDIEKKSGSYAIGTVRLHFFYLLHLILIWSSIICSAARFSPQQIGTCFETECSWVLANSYSSCTWKLQPNIICCTYLSLDHMFSQSSWRKKTMREKWEEILCGVNTYGNFPIFQLYTIRFVSEFMIPLSAWYYPVTQIEVRVWLGEKIVRQTK